MEDDNSIEVFGLSLQREAPSSISEEASSFFYEYFLENQTCYHIVNNVSHISSNTSGMPSFAA